MGSLTPGFYADLAMLSDNLLTIPADGLADIACVAAMVGGRWVHGGLDGPR